MRKLTVEGSNIALLIHRLMANVGVEVAIGAFRGTKRPVNINAETTFGGLDHYPSRQAFEKSWNALAR